jgi:crossover junction endodeoxyribonuclease RuvC
MRVDWPAASRIAVVRLDADLVMVESSIFRAQFPKSRVRRPREEHFSMSDSNRSASAASRDDSVAPEPARACPWPIVLGIDPGTRIVGYGAIVVAPRGARLLAAGVLRAHKLSDVPERLGWIQTEIASLLARVRPTVVVVEQAFAARNVQSALRIGEGRGVVLACAAAFGAEVVQYAPAVAKKALLGYGAADKTQVAKMVAEILRAPELPTPLDASDALALALAHAQRSRPLPLR